MKLYVLLTIKDIGSLFAGEVHQQEGSTEWAGEPIPAQPTINAAHVEHVHASSEFTYRIFPPQTPQNKRNTLHLFLYKSSKLATGRSTTQLCSS